MSEEVKKTTNVTARNVTASEAKQSNNNPGLPRTANGARNDKADKSVAPKKFERVANTAKNFNSDRPRRDRRDRRGDKPAEDKQFEEQTIAIDRVARVVKGGRRFRFKALVVVGDRKNKVGVGVAKGQDVQAAVTKATAKAKKSMITVPIVNTTIPHEVEVKVTGARVLLKPAAPGTGIIAGGVVRSVIGTTGITNLLSKSLGSNNKVNIAYATIKALESLVPKDQWIGAKPVKKSVKKEAAK
ncbi:MAG: 30S ribosomal protein S5 [Candidatus Nomurabacteria bacterium]|jgi:small subunit ribosomal protein S5|nr:30S ribosomal protein S5 [Candidatus Nomurabacteria bacterium]